MGEVLQKVFKAVENEISQGLPILGWYGLEASYFITDPRKISDVTILSDYMNKPWIKETLNYIKNIINNQDFIVQEPEKGEPVTPFMDVYKAKIQSGGSLDKLKLRILVGIYLKNK